MANSKLAVLFTIVAALLIGPMLLRTFYSSNKFFHLAEQQIQAGNFNEAIEGYQRAASWWLPFSSLSEDSLEKLLLISKDERIALPQRIEAVRAAQSALSSSRSFLSNLFPGRLALLKKVSESSRQLVPESESKVRENVQFQPGYAGQLLASLSFVLFLCSAGSFIWLGYSASGEAKPRRKISMVSGLICYLGWILGLCLA